MLRFLLTGALAGLVDFGVYMLLFKGMGSDADVSKAVSFVAGTLTAYLINRRWTFAAPPSRSRLAKAMVLYLVTFTVQVGLNHFLLRLLSTEGWGVTVGFVIAVGVSTVLNFSGQRAWIFRPGKA